MHNFICVFQPILKNGDGTVEALEPLVVRGHALTQNAALDQAKAAYVERHPAAEAAAKAVRHQSIIVWDGDDEYLLNEAKTRGCHGHIRDLLDAAVRVGLAPN